MTKDRNIWVADVEQLTNFHCICARNVDTKKEVEFVLHDKRWDFEEYIAWLRSGIQWVTYNGIKYDYPLVHFIMENEDSFRNGVFGAERLYEESQRLLDRDTPIFEITIPYFRSHIQQWDLFKIWHFDNVARATSLKWVEFAMRMENVDDMPFSHLDSVKEEDIPVILAYCWNDINATEQFYRMTLGKIALRDTISDIFGVYGRNSSDVKLGTQIFEKEILQATGWHRQDLREKRTFRKYIDLNKCILPLIKFKSKPFNDFLTWLKEQKITETKGVFRGKSVEYKGFKYDFGTGGIHGCIKPGIYTNRRGWSTIDADVASYYPSVAIVNRFEPAHLKGYFADAYAHIKDQRNNYPKKTHRNEYTALKLALNGSFGRSNHKDSWLYDPMFTMQITINGQLLLCMLAEEIVDTIPEAVMLQINTDGLTVQIPDSRKRDLARIFSKWEQKTKLELEYAKYEKMVIRDVNNYLAVYDSGKTKVKGVFEIDRDVHKNHSQRIVPIALHRYFVDDVPVKQTIAQHLRMSDYGMIENYGIYDFCKAVKGKGDFYFVTNEVIDGEIIEKPLHKRVNRYYMANKGVNIIKKHPDGRTFQVEASPKKGQGFKAQIFNKAFDGPYNINYQYYIRECNKIIDTVEEKSLNLFDSV